MPLKFQSKIKLLRHFRDHKLEFGCTTPEEYLEVANKFLTSPLVSPAKECINIEGDIMRYNLTTYELGILDIKRTYIVTYFSLSKRTNKSRLEYIRSRCTE